MHGEHRRQDAPGDGVVGGAACQRERAQRGSGEALFEDDPGEHGERGDGDRRAEEHHRQDGRHAFFEVVAAAQERYRDERAKREGGEDARRRHRDRGAGAVFDEVDVEVEPDEEHVEHQADLRDRVQHDVRWSRGKQVVLHAGRDLAQQRRSENHSGDHLADDLRLTDALRDESHHAAGGEDDGKLEEEVYGGCCGHVRFFRSTARTVIRERTPFGLMPDGPSSRRLGA